MEGGGSIEFNEDTEVASVSIDLTSDTVEGVEGGADKEDAYLRSVILEQIGSVDASEIGDLTVFVDDDRVDHVIAVDRDRFIINFGGKGVMIEEGDDVEITVEANTDRGYEETVQFAIDDMSDVYILGASYGYGLPVCFAGDDNCDGKQDEVASWDDNTKTSVATISSGKIAKGDRLKKFEDEVHYGDDVILGAYSVEFEGEDVLMEDLIFEVLLSNYPWTSTSDSAWVDADEDTVRFDSVRLRVDGENVAYASDSIDFDKDDADDSSGSGIDLDVEFDGGFTVDVRDDREVIFEIVADLDAAWGHFEGTSVEFTLTDVDTAEGVSSERDYTATGEYFASAIEFEDVKIMGNEISFDINDDGVDGTSFVRGADSVVFGTFEVDAKDAIDDVELRDLYLSFQIPSDSDLGTAVGDLSDLNNCRILDEGGDEIADSRGVTGVKVAADTDVVNDQARFRFDDYVVEAGEREDMDIVCDIDDGADSGDAFRISVDESASVNDRVKYRIGRDEDDMSLGTGSSSIIKIGSSGELTISTDYPDEDETVIAVATGKSGADDVAVLELELEAEKEDIEILDVYLSLPTNMGARVGGSPVAVDADELEEVYDRFTLKLGNTTADLAEYMATKTFAAADYVNQSSDVTGTKLVMFEDVNEIVREGDDSAETFDLTFDFNGIDDDDGVAGQFIQGSKLFVVWEGDDSGTVNLTEHTIGTGTFTVALPFPTVPTVSTTETDRTLKASEQKIYEFTVNADDEGDVYLGQVGFYISLGDGAQIDAGDIKVYRGTGNNGDSRGTNANAASAATKVEFTTPERIDAGESRTYSVYADVGNSFGDNASVTVQLLHDVKGTPHAGRDYAATKTAGNFVWSPNALDNDGATTSNADWFTGWTVVKDSDTKQWSLDR